MGSTTGISWCDATVNFWQGCRKVSPGCVHCYAERDMTRYGKNFKEVVRSKTTFNDPLIWARHNKLAPFSFIFTCSISDFFIEQADEWRDEAWNIMHQTPFIYLVLTKRVNNIESRLPKNWGDGYPNVYLGVTIESQDYVDRFRILMDIPCEKRFVSYEPALGMVNFQNIIEDVDWLIAGGESGPEHRPAQSVWFSAARNYCELHRKTFFFKQHGGTKKIYGAWGGNVLDGNVYHDRPETSERTKEFINRIVAAKPYMYWSGPVV